MEVLVTQVVPLVVIVAMAVVGSQLTVADFTRLAARPGPFAASVAGQLLVVPLLALGVALALGLAPAVAAGLVLVATCPVAAMANFYALVARADLALSVSLTAVSCPLAMVGMPVALPLAFGFLLDSASVVEVPAVAIVRQLATGVLAPVLAGMAIRRVAPGWVARNAPRLQAASLAAVAAVVVIVVVDQAAAIRAQFAQILAAAALFTAAALGAGYGIARALGWPRPVCATLGLTFAARNIGIAALIAAAIWGNFVFVAFGAVFFALQFLIFAPLLALWRRGRRPGPAPEPSDEPAATLR